MLTAIVFLPLLGAIAALLAGDRSGRRDGVVRIVALAASLVVFVLSLVLWARFNPSDQAPEFQFVEHYEWIPSFGISYFVGVDGISLSLIVLTAFLRS
jgi:NADH-quinone oxidoreductase subunit M